MNLSGNMLTGATKKHDLDSGGLENIDSDMAGFVALCAVLGQLTEVNLSDCGLGPASMSELAKVFGDADAALASINLSGNNGINQKSQRALQESASSRRPSIELIWDK